MLCLLFVLALFSATDSARILGIFPMPSISHQVVFQEYIKGLLQQGHEVVFVTPNPIQPTKNSASNLTEIDISYFHNNFGGNVNLFVNMSKRGVVVEAQAMFDGGVYEDLVHMYAEVFKNPQLKSLLEDEKQHFDLIVLEAIFNYHLIASKIFNAPVILLSSMYGLAESFDIMGAVSRHPILYPNTFRSRFRDLSTWGIIQECYQEYKIMKKMRDLEELENKLLKENFGPNTPTVEELKDNVAMLFLNSHSLFAENRPVPPGVIFLGALHLKPIKQLPQDLQSYLDNSKTGVVYVSLGSNVRPENMHKDMLQAFLDAFEALPYDVLWKYNATLEKMPKNLKIQEWFPQRDLLTHQNIKVFVTQGGIQSTEEAIDAGVPFVGIPMMGDQWLNTNKYVQLGIGKEVDPLTLTANDLTSAIKTVIEDPRKNIKHLKEVMLDQPQRPLERAMWWTEHVLRHRGARHLRAPAANMPWSQYLMLDVFIPVIFVLFISVTVVSLLVYFAIKTLYRNFTRGSKIKKS